MNKLEENKKEYRGPTHETKPSIEWIMEQNVKLIEENHKMKLIIDLLLEKIMKNRGDI